MIDRNISHLVDNFRIPLLVYHEIYGMLSGEKARNTWNGHLKNFK